MQLVQRFPSFPFWSFLPSFLPPQPLVRHSNSQLTTLYTPRHLPLHTTQHTTIPSIASHSLRTALPPLHPYLSSPRPSLIRQLKQLPCNLVRQTTTTFTNSPGSSVALFRLIPSVPGLLLFPLQDRPRKSIQASWAKLRYAASLRHQRDARSVANLRHRSSNCKLHNRPFRLLDGAKLI